MDFCLSNVILNERNEDFVDLASSKILDLIIDAIIKTF
jgi:hypothetical protein